MCSRGSVAVEGQPAAVIPSCTGLAVQAQVCALWPLECPLLASCFLGNGVSQTDFLYSLNSECSLSRACL